MACGSKAQKLKKATIERRRKVVAMAPPPLLEKGQPSAAASTPSFPIPPPTLEETLPSAEARPLLSIAFSNVAEASADSPPPLSIQCKNTALLEMVDMTTGEKAPKEHKHGFVVGTKTQYLMRMNGEQKLKVPYSARHSSPVTKD